jgi:hypothetical protein
MSNTNQDKQKKQPTMRPKLGGSNPKRPFNPYWVYAIVLAILMGMWFFGQDNPEITFYARAHNNANVLSLPGRFLDNDEILEILKVFLNTPFEGGRHERRVNKIPCG